MTTQPADEDTLIQAARAERGQHRSGASMFAMLGVAVAVAVAVALGGAGCLLIFVPHLVTMLLPGPLRLLGGFSMIVFITLGIVVLGTAGFFLLAAPASSPLASWGNKLPGDCPSCGQPRLRSDPRLQLHRRQARHRRLHCHPRRSRRKSLDTPHSSRRLNRNPKPLHRATQELLKHRAAGT